MNSTFQKCYLNITNSKTTDKILNISKIIKHRHAGKCHLGSYREIQIPLFLNYFGEIVTMQSATYRSLALLVKISENQHKAFTWFEFVCISPQGQLQTHYRHHNPVSQ